MKSTNPKTGPVPGRAANRFLRHPGLKDWLPATLPEDLDPEDSWTDSPTDLPGFPHFADETARQIR